MLVNDFCALANVICDRNKLVLIIQLSFLLYIYVLVSFSLSFLTNKCNIQLKNIPFDENTPKTIDK